MLQYAFLDCFDKDADIVFHCQCIWLTLALGGMGIYCARCSLAGQLEIESALVSFLLDTFYNASRAILYPLQLLCSYFAKSTGADKCAEASILCKAYRFLYSACG